MTRLPDPGEVLASQKHLRGQMLDRHRAVSWRPGRELAGRLMLRLDESHSCWNLPPSGYSRMDVERADGGYGSPSAFGAESHRTCRCTLNAQLFHRLVVCLGPQVDGLWIEFRKRERMSASGRGCVETLSALKYADHSH